MKLKNFFFAALAATFAFASCEQADPNGGKEPDVTQTGFVGAGEYWMVAGDYVATPLAADASDQFDYLDVVNVWKSSAAYASAEANAFVFTEVEGGYTIQTKDGRYLYLSGNYNSFNYSTEVPAEGHVWTVVEGEDGTCTITNVLKEKYVQYSVSYTSFGAYPAAQSGALMPVLVSVANPIDVIASLDASYLSFPAEGETKTVTATEGVTVSAESDNTAFAVSVNSNVISVTTVAVTEAQSGELTVTFTYGGYSIATKLSLSQAAPVSDDPAYLKIDRIADLTAGTYFIAGYLESYTYNGTTNDYSSHPYHLFSGSIGSGDLFTTQYAFSDGDLTMKPAEDTPYPAAEVIVAAVSGKADTYTLKVEGDGKGYLTTTEINNRKLAFTDSPVEWVAKDNTNGGITLSTTIGDGSVNLGTAGASSKLLRSYKSESTLKYGVVFFKANN